jgi:hypothetical protein
MEEVLKTFAEELVGALGSKRKKGEKYPLTRRVVKTFSDAIDPQGEKLRTYWLIPPYFELGL